jgi:hypothetical protein
MVKPCDVVKRVDPKTRTVVFDRAKRKRSFMLNLGCASHCDVCRAATALYKSDRPHNEVDE